MTENNETLLCVFIINRNTAKLLIDCLDHVYQSELANRPEVIVVDDVSTDDSVEQVRVNYPDVKIIEAGRNLGFAAANNRAAEIASGAFYLLVNTDAMLRQTEGSYIFAVVLAERLIGELTFREAYKVTASVVAKLAAEGRALESLKGAEVEAAAKELLGKDIEVSGSIGEKVSDPKEVLSDLRSPGSPMPVEAGAAVENLRELRERYWKELDFMKIKLVIAADNLKNAVQKHTA